MSDFSYRQYRTKKKKKKKKKQHVQIKDSYKVWDDATMCHLIFMRVGIKNDINLTAIMLEWWLHNIGYYLTKPFIFIPAIKKLNRRFKDVDLMV